MIGRLFDQRDVDLLVIKACCIILTILAVCGYLDAVSEIEQLFNVHIMSAALILLSITTLSFFVFHVRVRTDNSSDATLFNNVLAVTAITSEILSCFLVILISNQAWVKTLSEKPYFYSNWVFPIPYDNKTALFL